MLGRVHQKLLQLLHVRLAVETAAAALLGDLCDLVGELLGGVFFGLVLAFPLMGGPGLALLGLVLLAGALLLLLSLVLVHFGLGCFCLLLALGQLLGGNEPPEHLPLAHQILIALRVAVSALFAAVKGVGVAACAAVAARVGVRIAVGAGAGGGVGIRVRVRGAGAGGRRTLLAGGVGVVGILLLLRLEVVGVVPELLQIVAVGLVALLHLGAEGVEGLGLVLRELHALLLPLLNLPVGLLDVVLERTDGFDELLGRPSLRLDLVAELFQHLDEGLIVGDRAGKVIVLHVIFHDTDLLQHLLVLLVGV
mmetsp:Transcript_127498/g.302959  ORF Transcript_127498/g.302959 Transcript_127498/m.302959 type:complete len:308 (+) Transcript_127498:1936-2859(+)